MLIYQKIQRPSFLHLFFGEMRGAVSSGWIFGFIFFSTIDGPTLVFGDFLMAYVPHNHDGGKNSSLF